LRATPTKLSQTPFLPASASHLVPPCTAAARTARCCCCHHCCRLHCYIHYPGTAVPIVVLLCNRVVCNCRLRVSTPVASFASSLPHRCFRSSRFLCRSFRVASAYVHAHTHTPTSGGPATSKAVIDECVHLKAPWTAEGGSSQSHLQTRQWCACYTHLRRWLVLFTNSNKANEQWLSTVVTACAQ
jgi:hypothetical protein